MATVVNPSTNQIKLNNGATINAQNGGWYDAQQYWNGSLGGAGVGNNPNQTDIFQKNVPTATIAQTSPANVAYVQQQQQQSSGQPSNGGQPVPAVPTNTNTTVAATSTSAPSGGVGTPTLSPGNAPSIDIQAITNSAYNTPEITAAHDAISAIHDKIAARQQALADAQGEINDNPFYSEATRVGKSQQLTQQANADMSVLQNEEAQAQGEAASLRADAAIKVNAAMGQYNINEQTYKDNLTNFNNLLTSGALDNASGTDIANLATQTGIPTSMIQSMVSTSQKKNNPTQLIQATVGNDLQLMAIDNNGKVVSTTTIPGAGAKATTSTAGSAADKKQNEATINQSNLVQDIKNKVTLKSLVDHYAQAISIDDIYRLYNQYSPWGAATENLASVKQGRYADVANSGAVPAIK